MSSDLTTGELDSCGGRKGKHGWRLVQFQGRLTLVLSYPVMKKQISHLLALVLSMGAISIALQAASDQSANYTTRTLPLPDHSKGNITMDYIAYDSKTASVWVPAINIGSVYVVNTRNSTVREVSGFATNEVEVREESALRDPVVCQLEMA